MSSQTTQPQAGASDPGQSAVHQLLLGAPPVTNKGRLQADRGTLGHASAIEYRAEDVPLGGAVDGGLRYRPVPSHTARLQFIWRPGT